MGSLRAPIITAVGDAKGIYLLAGRADAIGNKTTNIGFVVSWQNQYANAESVTSWFGQLQIINKEEAITTFWLLTMETNPNLIGVPPSWDTTFLRDPNHRRRR